MDRVDNTPDALRGALRDIRLVNRWLGGERALLDELRPLLRAASPDRPFRVLDVGTGGADLPLAILRLGRETGRDVRITAVDRDPVTSNIARGFVREHPEIRVIQADGRAMPFDDGAFDAVVASLFLHHFGHDEIVALLREFSRLAGLAVVVNDLRRHRVAWLAILLLARLSLRHPMFVHDAPLSVLRGFTEHELARAARDAGFERHRPRRRWPFRLVLTLPGGASG